MMQRMKDLFGIKDDYWEDEVNEAEFMTMPSMRRIGYLLMGITLIIGACYWLQHDTQSDEITNNGQIKERGMLMLGSFAQAMSSQSKRASPRPSAKPHQERLDAVSARLHQAQKAHEKQKSKNEAHFDIQKLQLLEDRQRHEATKQQDQERSNVRQMQLQAEKEKLDEERGKLEADQAHLDESRKLLKAEQAEFKSQKLQLLEERQRHEATMQQDQERSNVRQMQLQAEKEKLNEQREKLEEGQAKLEMERGEFKKTIKKLEAELKKQSELEARWDKEEKWSEYQKRQLQLVKEMREEIGNLTDADDIYQRIKQWLDQEMSLECINFISVKMSGMVASNERDGAGIMIKFGNIRYHEKVYGKILNGIREGEILKGFTALSQNNYINSCSNQD